MFQVGLRKFINGLEQQWAICISHGPGSSLRWISLSLSLFLSFCSTTSMVSGSKVTWWHLMHIYFKKARRRMFKTEWTLTRLCHLLQITHTNDPEMCRYKYSERQIWWHFSLQWHVFGTRRIFSGHLKELDFFLLGGMKRIEEKALTPALLVFHSWHWWQNLIICW